MWPDIWPVLAFHGLVLVAVLGATLPGYLEDVRYLRSRGYRRPW